MQKNLDLTWFLTLIYCLYVYIKKRALTWLGLTTLEFLVGECTWSCLIDDIPKRLQMLSVPFDWFYVCLSLVFPLNGTCSCTIIYIRNKLQRWITTNLITGVIFWDVIWENQKNGNLRRSYHLILMHHPSLSKAISTHWFGHRYHSSQIKRELGGMVYKNSPPTCMLGCPSRASSICFFPL